MAGAGEFHRILTERAEAPGISILPDVADRLFAYYELLSRWNGRINLTSLPLQPLSGKAVDRLFLEPLFVAGELVGREEPRGTWIDVGSGGGSPAIPMRLVRPGGVMTLVESRSRKAAFLAEVVRVLGLPAVSVSACRFEDFETDLVARLVTVRAVRADVGLLGHIARILQRDGRLIRFGVPTTSDDVPAELSLLRSLKFGDAEGGPSSLIADYVKCDKT